MPMICCDLPSLASDLVVFLEDTMGCGVSAVQRQQAAEKVARDTETLKELRTLVNPDASNGEQALPTKKKALTAELERLEAVLDEKPAVIVITTLAGRTVVELQGSVNLYVSDLEKAVAAAEEFDLLKMEVGLFFNDARLASSQRLREVGFVPEQHADVTVMMKEKKRSPQLDQALFHLAWRGGSAEKVQHMLDEGAAADGYTYADGDRAIHVTAGRGCADVVKALIEGGADVNCPGVYGLTPLQRCSHRPTTYWKGWYPEIQEMIKEQQERDSAHKRCEEAAKKRGEAKPTPSLEAPIGEGI